MAQRQNIPSGTPWEALVGYSRAVRFGNTVEVSGTTAVDEQGGVVGTGDAYLQAQFILKKIEGALEQAGARMSDVVRTRTFVTDISRWKDVGRAHAEVFGGIRPAATMVEISALVSPELLVEIEVTAMVEKKGDSEGRATAV